mmetsp:Transcript_32300/g.68786  ORF Transcript_32300/g.68786 Transcript_32300/m.68786 type:complete len:340 (+) Transcript_32300:161-1180(+)
MPPEGEAVAAVPAAAEAVAAPAIAEAEAAAPLVAEAEVAEAEAPEAPKAEVEGDVAQMPSPEAADARSSPGGQASGAGRRDFAASATSFAASAKSTVSHSGVQSQPFLRSLSHIKSLPAISMKQRLPNSFIPPNSSPSPSSYDLPPTEQSSKHRSALQFSFTAGSRGGFSSASEDKPGPGHYGIPRNPSMPVSLKPSFGSAPRGRCVAPIRASGPGPGAYMPKSDFCSGPAFSAQGKRVRRPLKNRNMPGPGAYDPSMALTWQASPQVGIGTSCREDYMAKHEAIAPGPGHYGMQNSQGVGTSSAKFSVTSRRRSHDLDSAILPGPGMYTHGTSFGYCV